MKTYKMKVKGFTGKIRAGEIVAIVEINHGVATVRADDRTDFVMMEDLEYAERLHEPNRA